MWKKVKAASSRADFVSKYAIALRETRESEYRLKLFMASEIISDTQGKELHTEAIELTRMIRKAIVTAKKNAESPIT